MNRPFQKNKISQYHIEIFIKFYLRGKLWTLEDEIIGTFGAQKTGFRRFFALVYFMSSFRILLGVNLTALDAAMAISFPV